MTQESRGLKNHNTLGAIFILLVSLFGVIQGALVKELAGFHPTQILFLKSSIGILFLFIFFPSFRSLIAFKDFKFHLIKGVAGFLGNILSISALMGLSLMDCVSLAMTSAIFVSIGGVIIYKEKTRPMLWYSLSLCTLGVIIIMMPSFVVDYLPDFLVKNYNKDLIIAKVNVSRWYFLIPILGALMFAISSLSIKRLDQKGNSGQTILFSVMSIMSILSFPFALFYWQSLNLKQFLILFIMSMLYQLSHFLVIKAYSVADASFVAPFKYSRFPFAIIMSYLIGDVVDLNSLLGGAIIIIANYMLFTFSFDSAKKRKASKY